MDRLTKHEMLGMKSIDPLHYSLPCESRKVTSKFGQRWGRGHKGVDVKVAIGDTIRTAFDGVVKVSQYNRGGYGYYVVVTHRHGVETLYGHMSKLLVKPGQRVKTGDAVGLGGNTGHSTGSHLHFETHIKGVPINPALLFDFVRQSLTKMCLTMNEAVLKTKEKEAEAATEEDFGLLAHQWLLCPQQFRLAMGNSRMLDTLNADDSRQTCRTAPPTMAEATALSTNNRSNREKNPYTNLNPLHEARQTTMLQRQQGNMTGNTLPSPPPDIG